MVAEEVVPQANVVIRLGTKSESLERLIPHLRLAHILPLVYFRHDEWHSRPEAVLERIQQELGPVVPLIVRSSAADEDTSESSQAGSYLTVANVKDRIGLQEAIERVFDSYGRASDRDQVLVQPQLRDICACGVACSTDPATGSSYRIVSIAEGSDASAVTSGTAADTRTWYVSSGRKGPCSLPHEVEAVTNLLDELVALTGRQHIEVEFAFVSTGLLYLLQVRPLKVTSNSLSPQEHYLLLQDVARVIEHATTTGEDDRRLGSRDILGVMPDWNPAEMIGIRPRPLALSLYRHLITDRTWAEARRNYGYRDMVGVPLMIDIAGLPYIDVRASFSSFVPYTLPDRIARRLVDYYLDKLASTPRLHDKVEFEIVVSCYGPGIESRLHDLSQVLASDELEMLTASLRKLTTDLITASAPWKRELRMIERLSSVSNGEDLTKRLEDCLRYGTLPFSGLARAAFVAVEFLNGFVERGIIDSEERAQFLGQLNNVATTLVSEYARLPRDEFLAVYGHLRPGAYDVTAPRYDEDPDRYLSHAQASTVGPTARQEHTGISPATRREIAVLLAELGLEIDARELIDFISTSVRGREQAKFEFTHCLSDILRDIQLFGERLGFDRDEMSYVDIQTLMQATTAPLQAARRLIETAIAAGRERHAATCAISLPPLVTSASDVWAFEYPPTEPNFVGQSRCRAPVSDIAAHDSPKAQLPLSRARIPATTGSSQAE